MNKYVVGFIFITFLLDSCALKRCKGRQCTVRMVHFHNGDEYRGVSLFTYLFKNKNPRYGWGFPNLVKDPNGVENPDKNGYDKKSKAQLKVIIPKPPKEEKPKEEAKIAESTSPSSTPDNQSVK